jgi:hypothetical protein
VRSVLLWLLLFFTACAKQPHSFQGTWIIPGDGSRRLVITAHEGSFANGATGHTVKLRYVLRSTTEAAFMNEKGEVAIVCDLSEDGDNLQMFVQKSFGGGMSTFQRSP